MFVISSYEDLAEKWIDLQPDSKEAHGPCMMCPPNAGSRYNDDGVAFTGADRCWVHPYNIKAGINCRECKAAGRGPKGNGWWPINAVMRKLGAELDDDIVVTELPAKRPIHNLWRDAQVDAAHAAVDYDYWMTTCRWPKDLVDQFKLGYGNMLNAEMGMSHLIPMHPQRPNEDPVPGWYIAARKPGRKGSVRGSGSSKDYVWFVETDRSSETVCLVESEKNVITAVHLGYKNAVATYGSGNVYPELITWLWSLGYRHIVLMGDTGTEGEHFNQAYAKFATWAKFDSIKEIAWPVGFGDNYDITDLNRDKDNARHLIDSWLSDIYVPDGDAVSADDDEVLPLEVLRGEGPQSIYGIISEFYKSYKPGTMLNLVMPPGMGKTHTLLRFVQEIAAEHKTLKQIEWDELNEQLAAAQDEKTREVIAGKLDRFSFASVAWFGQYIDQWSDLV
ncbi:MAG: toprim domain-containing protein, partial [Burkholderiales bacterium]|nr:toprim domain-containing protein [Anaerolineae bacterium]